LNQIIQNLGVALAKKLIDAGVARLSGPQGTPEQRIRQIDKVLETLESEPEVVQHLDRTPAEASEVSEDTSQSQDIATACVACALGHFSRSAGALEEAMRFKDQGITSNEILDRIGGVLKEQNTLERYDLTPEKLRRSPPWEREIAEKALVESRRIRHVLEGLESIEQLETVAAETAAFYRNLNREWFQKRFAHRGGGSEVPPENSSEESS